MRQENDTIPSTDLFCLISRPLPGGFPPSQEGGVMGDTFQLRCRALQFLRDLRGWTQQELADAAWVSKLRVGYWEQGVRIPSPEKFRELTRLMGHTETTVREVLRLLSPPVVLEERW